MSSKTTNRIREFRRTLGLTQEQLAQEVGVTRLTIISLENRRYEPSVGLALKLGKAFDRAVEDLFVVEE